MKYPRISSSGDPDRPYRLDEEYQFHTSITGFTSHIGCALLTDEGTLYCYPGYKWDLATGAVDTLDMVTASLAHDIVCDMVNAGKLPWKVRHLGDGEFRKILARLGCWVGRRWYSWVVVRANSILMGWIKSDD